MINVGKYVDPIGIGWYWYPIRQVTTRWFMTTSTILETLAAWIRRRRVVDLAWHGGPVSVALRISDWTQTQKRGVNGSVFFAGFSFLGDLQFPLVVLSSHDSGWV